MREHSATLHCRPKTACYAGAPPGTLSRFGDMHEKIRAKLPIVHLDRCQPPHVGTESKGS